MLKGELIDAPANGTDIMNFGKHKADSYWHVISTNPMYTSSVMEEVSETSCPEMQRFAAWVGIVQNQTVTAGLRKPASGADIMNFGKHKADSYWRVISSDQGYTKWVMEEVSETSCLDMQRFAAWVGIVQNQSVPAGLQPSAYVQVPAVPMAPDAATDEIQEPNTYEMRQQLQQMVAVQAAFNEQMKGMMQQLAACLEKLETRSSAAKYQEEKLEDCGVARSALAAAHCISGP